MLAHRLNCDVYLILVLQILIWIRVGIPLLRLSCCIWTSIWSIIWFNIWYAVFISTTEYRICSKWIVLNFIFVHIRIHNCILTTSWITGIWMIHFISQFTHIESHANIIYQATCRDISLSPCVTKSNLLSGRTPRIERIFLFWFPFLGGMDTFWAVGHSNCSQSCNHQKSTNQCNAW